MSLVVLLILSAGAVLAYALYTYQSDSLVGTLEQQSQAEEPYEQKKRRGLGLTQLWPGDRAVRGATIEYCLPGHLEFVADSASIVAIHGLDTRSPTTWEAYRNNVHWLRDSNMLHEKFPTARIYTYDWLSRTVDDAVEDGLRGHASTLLDELRHRDSPGRHLIIIASCFGGLLLAQAVTLASKEQTRYGEMLEGTIGMLFLGTPFHKSDAGNAALLRVRVARAMGGPACEKLVRYLMKDNDALEDMIGDFENIIFLNKSKFQLTCYYETERTQIYNAVLPRWIARRVPFGNFILVPRDSVRIAGCKLRPIHVKHGLLNKFSGPGDKNFLTVCTGLQELISLAEQSDVYHLLKKYYGDGNGQPLRIERLSGKLLPLDKCYINLCIIEHDRDSNVRATRSVNKSGHHPPSAFSLPSRLEVETPPTQKQVTLETLFEPRRRSDGAVDVPKRVLIWGSAGVGKSTLCKKIVYEFVNNGLWNDRFGYIFWFPLRALTLMDTSLNNLEDITLKCFFRTTTANHELFRSQLRNIPQERILYILDGLDEVSYAFDSAAPMGQVLQELLERENTIVTSRPHSTNLLQGTPPDLELETIGFFPAQVEEYIKIAEEQTPQTISEIQSFIQSRPIVQSLVRIPVLLDAVCFCWRSNFFSTDIVTMTTLYESIESKLWDKYLTLRDGSTNSRIRGAAAVMKSVEGEIDFLGKLAFHGLRDEVIEFDAEHIRKAQMEQKLMFNDDLVYTSFLRSSDHSLQADDQSYHFIHLTFQEYFAARYFVGHWTSGTEIISPKDPARQRSASARHLIDPRDFVRQEKYSARYNMFWRFVVGLLQTHGVNHLHDFFEVIESEPRDLLESTHQRLIIRCLNEVHLNDDQFEPQARLFEEYQEWLLFSGKPGERMLGKQMECPDRVVASLCQGSETMRTGMSCLTHRPHVSAKLLNIVLDVLKQSPGEEVKRHAYRILGQHCHRSSAQHLVDFWEGLDHLQLHERREVVHNLQSVALEQLAIEALARLGRDEDFVVRLVAIRALGSQDQLPEPVVNILVQIIKDKHEHSNIRKAAARALGYQPKLSEIVVNICLPLLNNINEDPKGWCIIIGAFIRHHCELSNTIIEALVWHLENTRAHADIRREAIEGFGGLFGELPEAVVNALIRIIKDKREDGGLRREAAKHIPLWFQPAEPVFDAFMRIFEDKSENIDFRRRAMDLIYYRRQPPKAVINALIRIFEDTSENFRIRCAAVQYVSSVGKLPEPVISGMMALLEGGDEDENEDFSYRKALAYTLSLQAQLPEPVVDTLERHLSHPYYRSMAMSVLKGQSQLKETTIETLVLLLADPDDDIRSLALTTLGEQDHLPVMAIEALVNLPEKAFNYPFVPRVKAFRNPLSPSTFVSLLSLPEHLFKRQSVGLILNAHDDHWYSFLSSSNSKAIQNVLEFWLHKAFNSTLACYVVDESLYINAEGRPVAKVWLGKEQLEVFRHAHRAFREKQKFRLFPRM